MPGVISGRLENIMEQTGGEQVSVIIEASPGRGGNVRDRLEDQGLRYREATVANMTIFETVATPAEVQSISRQGGVERVDHNPTFQTQGARIEESAMTQARNVNRTDLKTVTDAMDVPSAWETIGNRGDGVKIGMVDTGVAIDHPAFDDATITQHAQPDSGEDHGTWIAGAMVGGEVESPDGRGEVRGVAPNAELYTDGALSGGRGDFIDVANGAGWCYDQGVDILNLSLGGGHSSIMHNMVKELTNNGVRVISSAGNSGPASGTVTCPGHHRETIAVASVSLSGDVAGFSSRGPGWTDAPAKPDIACYGGGSTDTRKVTEMILGPGASGTFGYLAGTSMAAPLVAGTQALQLARGE